MSLFKVPCILAAIVSLQIAITPPHPQPSAVEQLPLTNLDVIVTQRYILLVIKWICCATAVAESAVIIANNTQNWQLSQYVLSMLVLEGSAEQITASPLFLLGTSLTCFGGFIRYKCYRALGRLFTFEMSIRKGHKLVTSGPYSIVRHPGYTGVVLTAVGIVCLHACSGSWARECGALGTKTGQLAAGIYLVVVPIIISVLISRMSREDEALEKTFGCEWADWAVKVPYKLLPGLY